MGPVITYVSTIQPIQTQNIVIYGSGFGNNTPYVNEDSQYISIYDETSGWEAGYSPDGNCVTLDVGAWTDTEIVITGFNGAYGWGNWVLNSGDEILVSVWNPQTDTGPATYVTYVQ